MTEDPPASVSSVPMRRVDLMPFSGPTLDRLAGMGIDVDAALTRAGVADLTRPLRLTTAQFFALWQAIQTPDTPRDLGLRIGETSLLSRAHIASNAALHARNLGEALARYARYKRLSCPEEISIDVVRGEARVRFEWLLAAEDPPAFLVDGVFSAVLSLARVGTETMIVPRRIALTRRKRDVTMLRQWFGCAIDFDAPADLIAFEERALALPFATYDPAWSDSILPGLTRMLTEEGLHRTIADDVRAALGKNLGERPSVDRIARALGMSGRTLQRRLGEAGTTYQAVLDEVRRRSARRLLANTDLDSASVAFLLGFEELNSFTRAFHAWEGVTPARWRTSP